MKHEDVVAAARAHVAACRSSDGGDSSSAFQYASVTKDTLRISHLLAAYDAKLPTEFPPNIDHLTIYKIFDSNREGQLMVLVDNDGDAHVTVANGRGMNSLEFCTHAGGGRAPRTRLALIHLAEAIRQDTEDLAV